MFCRLRIAFLLVLLAVPSWAANTRLDLNTKAIKSGGVYWATTELEVVNAQSNSAITQVVNAASWSMTANRTLTKPLRCEAGGIITTTGYTLTLTGGFDAGLYQAFAGTGTVAGLKEARPEWFGAAGTGATDDSSHIQAAITSVGATSGGGVVVLSKTYRVDAAVNMASNVTVRCEPGAVIDGAKLTGANNLVNFTGAVESEYYFAASRTRGDTTISLSGSPGFAVGDIVHLVSYASVFEAGEYNLGYHPTDHCYYAEWNIIAQDLGGGVYRLSRPLELPGWTTLSKAKKVTPIQNAHWVGGTVNRLSGTATVNFYSNWAVNCSVRQVVSNDKRNGNIVIWMKSWKCEASDIISDNDPSKFYDYALDHANLNRYKTVGSQDCGFVRIKDSYGGQTVDFTYSSYYAPYSNVRSYCKDSFFYRNFEGLTSHQGCYQEQWVNNTIVDAYDDGMVIRGYQPTIIGNIITSNFTESGATAAGSLRIGVQYEITSVGTTDFTLIGAASNTIGVDFVATGVGSGTGTATRADTYGIRLGYGGSRKAHISGNTINGFYGGIGFYGSGDLGYWSTIDANIHGNDISHCYVGLIFESIGETGDYRKVVYDGNYHSFMGRYVVRLPEYVAGISIINNVLNGAFSYTSSYVAFVAAPDGNCPALVVRGNVWNRPKGSNPTYNKYMTYIASVDDTTTFPEADWAAQTVTEDNYIAWDTDSNVTYYYMGATNYRQNKTGGKLQSAALSTGVVTTIPDNTRIWSVSMTPEDSAASDDLDQLQPYTNTSFNPGDIVYLKSNASANNVVIRDIATSGASSYGFQTPGNTSITLESSADVVGVIFTGTHWSVFSQSAN